MCPRRGLPEHPDGVLGKVDPNAERAGVIANRSWKWNCPVSVWDKSDSRMTVHMRLKNVRDTI